MSVTMLIAMIKEHVQLMPQVTMLLFAPALELMIQQPNAMDV